MTTCSFPTVRNGQKLDLRDIPVLPLPEFRDAVVKAVRAGARISALFGVPMATPSAQAANAAPAGSAIRMFAVLTREAEGTLAVASTSLSDSYSALTPDCPQAHWF
jgi:hypothetical protein